MTSNGHPTDFETERHARAYLVAATEPPAPALGVFVAEQGPVVAAERVSRGMVPSAVERETTARSRTARAAEDLARAASLGARLVTPEDDEWPAWPLLSLDVARDRGNAWLAPPLALWARGTVRLDEAALRAVTVVGARAATAYGERVAADFGFELVEQGNPVCSGAAYGVDGAAHRGALAAGGPTLAVLGCGLDAGYPAGHAGLLDRIAQQGVVISEYPFGTSPARHRFLVRNRLLAAVAAGTVVVEAGLRSGARNTASTAGVLGKAVMAVPGPVSSAMSAGCHELVSDGDATLVASAAAVADAVGPLRPDSPDGRGVPTRATDGLGREALRVYEALRARDARSAESVAHESGVPLTRVRALLPELEVDRLAERTDDGWRGR